MARPSMQVVEGLVFFAMKLDEKIKELRHAYLQQEPPPAIAWEFLQEHELVHAYTLLLARRAGVASPPLNLKQLKSGCLPLLRLHFFPWQGLPYPEEHAELGSLLLQMEEAHLQEIALKMAAFQYATLDHEGKPLFSIFRQEVARKYEELQRANSLFFAALPATVKKAPTFLDAELGIFAWKREEETFFSTASGCKSGMGAHLFRDVGILNFAPQKLPLGECERFGLAGRAMVFSFEEKGRGVEIASTCRLASSRSGTNEIDGLMNSSYSGLWISAKLFYELHQMRLVAQLEGTSALENWVFSFFIKGKFCFVAGSHKLAPRSLDRYLGPPQEVEVRGERGKCSLQASGAAKMEVIPLIGGDHFWGADFLIAYTLEERDLDFSCKMG
jgi:hypothetical protein